MKADKEERKAAQVKADADRVQMQERMEAHRRELKEIMEKIMNSNQNEMLACREMTEEHLEEKKPTSPDRKLEAAQQAEVPAENATVIPVEEPKKKRRRDRKLAAERRRQEPKDTKKINGGPQQKLAVARRGMSHRAEVARKIQANKKMPRRATVARRMRDIFRPNMTRRAKVARQQENSVRRDPTRDKLMLGTSKGWALRRDNGCNRNVTRGIRIEAYEKTTGLQIEKRVVGSHISLGQDKDWTLWRGRPSLKREKKWNSTEEEPVTYKYWPDGF
jgi:hypothetical protein